LGCSVGCVYLGPSRPALFAPITTRRLSFLGPKGEPVWAHVYTQEIAEGVWVALVLGAVEALPGRNEGI
jgi:hypothetical protein